MAFKLAIADRVAVRVKGRFKGAAEGEKLAFDFTLDMDRLSQAEFSALQESGDRIDDFLVTKCHGWTGQRLVLQEDGKTPADYSPDAFRAMLGLPGMPLWVYQALVRDCGVQEKN